tara:strand:- start:423 stop:1214 length:792 start_codon:yes stop_codon:yes gene_type:complete
MQTKLKVKNAPIVLFIGGHDPSGGAGIQADIETANLFNCRSISLITCLTAQDSSDVELILPQKSNLFSHQANLLLSDIKPNIIKIGLLGNLSIAKVVYAIVNKLNVPVILDPIISAGGGRLLSDESLVKYIREFFLPITNLITPNKSEALLLAKTREISEAMKFFIKSGCSAGLITGADQSESNMMINHFFTQELNHEYEWPLLPKVYHGSGCTLSSACACELASGKPLREAVENAQKFTWEVLQKAENVGSSQWFPNRRCKN